MKDDALGCFGAVVLLLLLLLIFSHLSVSAEDGLQDY